MNHSQAHGPLMSELFFPTDKKIWCTGEMMNRKEIPAYAYKDFWSYKPKWTKWFYKLASHIIAPVFAYVFNNADCLPVYKDMRIMTTYKETVKALENGANVIIFPESSKEYNEIINEFQDKFVDVARLYYARTKKDLSFVPCYHAVELKKVVFGNPITFEPQKDKDEHRKEIIGYLKEQITALAKELPVHSVVPYANINKKLYPKSK
jgi:1-acyl-sn-glycerol-3-phosphate acyltransferase